MIENWECTNFDKRGLRTEASSSWLQQTKGNKIPFSAQTIHCFLIPLCRLLWSFLTGWSRKYLYHKKKKARFTNLIHTFKSLGPQELEKKVKVVSKRRSELLMAREMDKAQQQKAEVSVSHGWEIIVSGKKILNLWDHEFCFKATSY